MITPVTLVRQMLETVSDDLPDRWKMDWHAMEKTLHDSDPTSSLQEWLEELYFDGERREDMSREDILRVGALIGSMLRMERSATALVKDVVQDAWFLEE